MKQRKKNGYYYSGHRVTDSELENINKELTKKKRAEERIAEIMAMPAGIYIAYQSELNSLRIQSQHAEFWIEYILTHGKYSKNAKSQEI